jgi:hypothetical protein
MDCTGILWENLYVPEGVYIPHERAPKSQAATKSKTQNDTTTLPANTTNSLAQTPDSRFHENDNQTLNSPTPTSTDTKASLKIDLEKQAGGNPCLEIQTKDTDDHKLRNNLTSIEFVNAGNVTTLKIADYTFEQTNHIQTSEHPGDLNNNLLSVYFDPALETIQIGAYAFHQLSEHGSNSLNSVYLKPTKHLIIKNSGFAQEAYGENAHNALEKVELSDEKIDSKIDNTAFDKATKNLLQKAHSTKNDININLIIPFLIILCCIIIYINRGDLNDRLQRIKKRI